MNSALQQIFKVGLAAAIPSSDLTCARWAEQFRYVSPERSARAGIWKNSVVPFLREIMDAASDPNVRRLVFQKSSQVAGSEFLNNYLAYRIHIDPTMMIYCAENEDKAKAWAYESFDTMREVTPVLRERVTAKNGSEDNNQRRKKFPGGLLSIVFASSASQLSSRPAEVVAIDEVDACVENSEGSPVALLEARTKTFDETKKILLVSSPRDKETSVIEAEYLASDQRQFFVPCLHCSEFQILKWSNVRWDNDPLEAYYVCDLCGALIEHDEKAEMLSRGYWQAAEEFRGSAGFKINEMYSPFTSWGTMANAFVKAKKFRSTLRTFINTSLGETWEEQGEQVEFADLAFHCEEYDAQIPNGALVLTAGVDVQDDRLEIEVVGWGKDLESWSIHYEIIEGSPGLVDVWDSLSDFLMQGFEDASGNIFKIKAVCIDSGGHHTTQVYKFCKANAGRRWFAIKGSNQAAQPIAPKTFKIVGKNKTRLYHVGTDTAKDEIFAFLKKSSGLLRAINDANFDSSHEEFSNAGFCHFPHDREESYFKQLCSEKKVTKYTMGVARKVYEKVSASARNEALDCRVYATAARAILNPNLDKMSKKQSKKDENELQNEHSDGSNAANEAADSDKLSENDDISSTGTAENRPKKRRVNVNNSFIAGRSRRSFATNY